MLVRILQYVPFFTPYTQKEEKRMQFKLYSFTFQNAEGMIQSFLLYFIYSSGDCGIWEEWKRRDFEATLL